MAKSNRDEFTQETKRTLQDRAGNRCSNPTCRCLTSGPNCSDSKATRVGAACHVTAASQGGPLFNSRLIQEDRKSVQNGIWLCLNHGTLMDEDEENYPVELLIQWKAHSEYMARCELEGKIEVQEQDGYLCYFCDTLFSAEKKVCTGCQAEIVYDSSNDERNRDFIQAAFADTDHLLQNR